MKKPNPFACALLVWFSLCTSWIVDVRSLAPDDPPQDESRVYVRSDWVSNGNTLAVGGPCWGTIDALQVAPTTTGAVVTWRYRVPR